jgi:hypothetical protein
VSEICLAPRKSQGVGIAANVLLLFTCRARARIKAGAQGAGNRVELCIRSSDEISASVDLVFLEDPFGDDESGSARGELYDC